MKPISARVLPKETVGLRLRTSSEAKLDVEFGGENRKKKAFEIWCPKL
jgi:hypothetical protein